APGRRSRRRPGPATAPRPGRWPPRSAPAGPKPPRSPAGPVRASAPRPRTATPAGGRGRSRSSSGAAREGGAWTYLARKVANLRPHRVSATTTAAGCRWPGVARLAAGDEGVTHAQTAVPRQRDGGLPAGADRPGTGAGRRAGAPAATRAAPGRHGGPGQPVLGYRRQPQAAAGDRGDAGAGLQGARRRALRRPP